MMYQSRSDVTVCIRLDVDGTARQSDVLGLLSDTAKNIS